MTTIRQEDVERKMKAEDKRESLENMNLKNEMKTLKKTLSADDEEADEEDEGSKGSVDEEERKETRTGAGEKKEQELSSNDSTSTSTTDDESETSSEDKTEPLTMDMDKIKWLIQILEMTVSRRSRSTRDQTACASPFSANLSQRARFRDSRDQTDRELDQIEIDRELDQIPRDRESAQACLQQMAETNLHEFVQQLSAVLVAVGAGRVARKAAGLQLKNQLTSEDPDMKFQYQQRWLTIPVKTREYIKNNILGALGTENNRPSSAAQCVAYVAVAELAVGQWSELIPLLVNNVVNATSTEMMKEATLETIGYIWQEITYDIYSTSQHVRLAALRALYNSMKLFKGNFEIETERNFIMGVVCEATQSTNIQIRVAALQCLVKIMSLYYLYMEPYMSAALFPITLEAMKSDIDEVALQGIEFWLNVFKPKHFFTEEDPDARRSFVKFCPSVGDVQYLVQVLTKKLNINMNHFCEFAPWRHRSQEEFEDEFEEEFEDEGSLSNVRPIRNIDREYRHVALKYILLFCDFMVPKRHRRHNADNQRCYLKNDSYFS